METDLSFLPSTLDRSTENRLIRVVFNTDLRCGHAGLAALAKGLRLNVDNLKIGQFIVFINRKKCALKLYAAGNTVAHFRMPGSRQMDMSVIALIPRFFNGKELKYDDALAEVIKKQIRH
jgi:hypothetical protein